MKNFMFLLSAVLIFPVSAQKNMDVVVHMTSQQSDFFEKSVIRVFEKKYGLNVTLRNVKNLDEMISACRKYNKSAGLIMLPIGPAWECVRREYCRPLELVIRDSEIKKFNETYILTEFGRLYNKQYFMPRKYETRIMAYRKSRVIDALEHFDSLKAAIDSSMKVINGRGLPEGYRLEKDPARWDFFDIFTVGKIWSMIPYPFEEDSGDSASTDSLDRQKEILKPRIAHRGGHYSGTSLRLIDRVFQCGADTSSMLNIEGDAVIDAFQWEAVYTWAGIYNPDMISNEWRGRDIWKAFSTGEVFLSFMTQMDCFELHNRQFADMGYTVMPAGCSVAVTRGGNAVREGTKKVTTGGWWWAIPKGYPYPDLSVILFGYITSIKFHLKECLNFGMIPVRHDVLKNSNLFENWQGEIFRESYRQIQINKNNFIVKNPAFNEISDLYLKAWIEIAAENTRASEKDTPPDREYIKNILADYSEKAKRKLK